MRVPCANPLCGRALGNKNSNASMTFLERQRRAPYQPGAKPQVEYLEGTRAESPLHCYAAFIHGRPALPMIDGSGLQPSVLGPLLDLGRCPRLVWIRAVGPSEGREGRGQALTFTLLALDCGYAAMG